MALPAENAAKVTCEKGHPLLGENLMLVRRSSRGTERVCRICARERSRRHYVPRPRPVRPEPAKKERTVAAAYVPRPRPTPTPLIERVLAKVEKTDGCWLWTGATTNGYGIVQRGRRGEGTARVHRVVYEHFKGPIPEGLDAMHSCHVRNCANPAHLEAGTRAENMAQSQKDGRLRRHAVTRTNA